MRCRARKRRTRIGALSRGRSVGQGRHVGQHQRGPGRALCPIEKGPRAGQGGRFRSRGLAVEECGDNAPSVTAGPRGGRERRRGR